MPTFAKPNEMFVLGSYFWSNRLILRTYAHDDISVGSWFVGLDVKHVDEGKFCCSSWSSGIPSSYPMKPFGLVIVPKAVANASMHSVVHRSRLCVFMIRSWVQKTCIAQPRLIKWATKATEEIVRGGNRTHLLLEKSSLSINWTN